MQNNEDLNGLLDAEGAATERDMAGDREPVPGTTVTRGHSRIKTLQVRLNEDEYAAIQGLADEQNLPVSTLARSILLPALMSTTSGRSSNDPSQTATMLDTNVLLVIIERMRSELGVVERVRSELDLLSRRIAS